MHFTFNHIKPFDTFSTRGTYIILFHVDKIPPHLGLVVDEKYYSITIKEVELGLNVNKMVDLIKRKKIPTIIIEVDDKAKNVSKFYSKYNSLKEESITCLTPIKEYFSVSNSFNSTDIKVIFDLLDTLVEKNKVIQTFELNLSHVIHEGKYAMKKYSFHQLNEQINKLRLKDKTNA